MEDSEDSWGFYYDGISTNPVVITLRGYGLSNPIAVLVDSNGTEIGWDAYDYTDNVWTSTFNYGTLPTDNYYRILVKWDDAESNGWGTYSLSVNDPDEELERYFPANGTLLDNTAVTTAGVTILPTAMHPFNQFNENNAYGLAIYSNGPVNITNANAGRNMYLDGVHVETQGAVILQSTNAFNPDWLSENGFNGVYVRTKGAITLANVQANDNWDPAQTWITRSANGMSLRRSGTTARHRRYHNWRDQRQVQRVQQQRPVRLVGQQPRRNPGNQSHGEQEWLRWYVPAQRPRLTGRGTSGYSQHSRRAVQRVQWQWLELGSL